MFPCTVDKYLFVISNPTSRNAENITDLSPAVLFTPRLATFENSSRPLIVPTLYSVTRAIQNQCLVHPLQIHLFVYFRVIFKQVSGLAHLKASTSNYNLQSMDKSRYMDRRRKWITGGKCRLLELLQMYTFGKRIQS